MKNDVYSMVLAASVAAAMSSVLPPPVAAAVPAQPLNNGWPVGKGLDALLQDCSGCHTPALVKNERHDSDGWDNLIGVMIGRGAQVSDADEDLIRAYLAKNFGPTTPVSK